jgi:Prokaryotic E2 family E
VQDGLEARRHFALPPEDIVFLDSLKLRWETIAEGGNFWVIIYGVPLSPGFTEGATDVAIQIMPGYPTSPLDMAYFHPPVLRQDGRSIANADALQPLDERMWQRWSRHRIGGTTWVPGEDNLERHFMFMQDWWAREIAQ